MAVIGRNRTTLLALAGAMAVLGLLGLATALTGSSSLRLAASVATFAGAFLVLQASRRENDDPWQVGLLLPGIVCWCIGAGVVWFG